VLVPEVGHELEVDDLPGKDVADTRDQRDRNPDREGLAEGDMAATDVVAIRPGAEEDQQKRQYDDGIAANIFAVAEACLVGEGQVGHHQNGGDGAGNQSKGEDRLFHQVSPVSIALYVDPESSGLARTCRHTFE